MNVPIDVATWSAFGLTGLILLAGTLLAWRHRGGANRTTDWLAVVGLLCVLADHLLGVGFGLAYFLLTPGEGSADYWQAQRLGQYSLDYVTNLTGAIGWGLVVAAVFAEARPSQGAGRTKYGGLR
ncbi:hypothetical protein [Microlunatus sp. GCM10028923]|uniref:hypothetical protein n=1 Tax=Microlunatus sp. GCM10028923 TaxID=3273400 RepID=UPI0036110F7E